MVTLLLCHPWWPFYSVIHCDPFTLSSMVALLLCHPWWPFYSVIHCGPFTLSSMLTLLLYHSWWPFYSVIHGDPFTLSSMVTLLLCHPWWPCYSVIHSGPFTLTSLVDACGLSYCSFEVTITLYDGFLCHGLKLSSSSHSGCHTEYVPLQKTSKVRSIASMYKHPSFYDAFHTI